jgi:hypothetical protein
MYNTYNKNKNILLYSVLNVQCHQTKGLPLANCSQLGPVLELSTLSCSSRGVAAYTLSRQGVHIGRLKIIGK